ncbi:MAG: hypothetical protein IMZ61_08570 [Planctomycetes bacterium]|nr:hypothetical protein [Candidatus Atribacteria bacterium]MBE3143962.1 hypothetical protein [Planctomycetota bacterium]
MKQQEATLIIAIYGATIATVAAVWNIAQLFRLRRRLRIEAAIGPVLGVWDKKQMLISVTNLGVRPITVHYICAYKNWRGSRKGAKVGGMMTRPEGWPVSLKHEGDRVGTTVERFEELCSGQYGYMCVVDSVNKKWRIPRKIRLQLIERAADTRPFPAPDRIIEEREDGTRITHIKKKDV